MTSHSTTLVPASGRLGAILPVARIGDSAIDQQGGDGADSNQKLAVEALQILQ